MILVAPTERPAMPTSMPVLDALKAKKSAHMDKRHDPNEAFSLKKRRYSRIKDGRFQKEDRGCLWCCFRDETKQRFD